MGLRRKKTPAAPVRAGQVQRLVKAIRDEHYAIVCDEGPSGHTEYQRARATLAAVERASTKEEIAAAYAEAVNRR